MKIIYFGSSGFSLIILKELLRCGFWPELVVSQPDRPKGRGLSLKATEVSSFASESRLALIKPASIKTCEVKNAIKGFNPDLFIVADYGKILTGDLLKIPKIASLGVHPSILPLYRGSAPINWTLLNGDKETGVTIFKMDEALDAGAIFLQTRIAISNEDNVITLHEKLAKEGARLIVEALRLIESGNYKFVSQNERISSLAPKLQKQNGNIKWSLSAESILNLIRATLGWPSAYTYFKGKLIQIVNAQIAEGLESQLPSVITKIDKDGIYVSTGKDALKIKTLKPQGKKEMPAYAFAIGQRLRVGDKFD